MPRRPFLQHLLAALAAALLTYAGSHALLWAATPRTAPSGEVAEAGPPPSHMELPPDPTALARAAEPADAAPAAVEAPAHARAEPVPVRLSDLGKQASGDWSQRGISLLGLSTVLLLCFLLSENRRRIPWHLVISGVGLQIAFGIIVLKTEPGQWVFAGINNAFLGLVSCADAGSNFVFGNLKDYVIPTSDPKTVAIPGAVVAFRVLPIIIFFASLTSVLYHLGVMQRIVGATAWLMRRTMGTSGAETLSASANIFLGMTEAPLLVRPFIERMTNSELNAVMVGGFATVAGSVMGAYIAMLESHFSDIGIHLLAASVMSAPAGLVCAKMMVPETQSPETAGHSLSVDVPRIDSNFLDAAARGASEGLQLALNVGGMLIAFIGLVALANLIVGKVALGMGFENVTIQSLLGLVFWPFAWLMGIPSQDCLEAGKLLAIKTVLNEFIAYQNMSDMLAQPVPPIQPRTAVLLSYALCGFANLGSIAIQLGGIGVLAPSRRKDLARMGFKAMVAGTLACQMTAQIAGLLI